MSWYLERGKIYTIFSPRGVRRPDSKGMEIGQSGMYKLVFDRKRMVVDWDVEFVPVSPPAVHPVVAADA
jgi:hypothetical protein